MWDVSLFTTAVEATLRHWPSFQLALSNGMGGPNTEDKFKWMSDSIVELFKMNEQTLQIDDVADYVSEMINNEFDTIIEDSSTEMVCSTIIAYFNHIFSGNAQYVLDKLEALKQKQELLNKQNQQSVPIENKASQQNVLSTESTSTGDIEMDNADNVDDGWTVVKRKR